MPPVPKLTDEYRKKLRLHDSSHSNAKNLEDVVRCYRETRHAVVHYWTSEPKDASKGTAVPYRALDLYGCEKASQVIRLCNQELFDPLYDYYNKCLKKYHFNGLIIPDSGQERTFCSTEEALMLYPKQENPNES